MSTDVTCSTLLIATQEGVITDCLGGCTQIRAASVCRRERTAWFTFYMAAMLHSGAGMSSTLQNIQCRLTRYLTWVVQCPNH